MSQFAQDAPCLRFSENINPQREITYEGALSLLLRGTVMAANVPFTFSYIDKPSDGTIFLLYLTPNAPFPNDGIRYQDTEVKYNIPAGPRELEVHEIKSGFIPGSQEPAASRVRRRYRIVKGANPQFVLVHYTRGSPTPIQPVLMNQPVRAYPLRPINEPSVYVTGEKAGQKVYPPGVPMHGGSGQNMPPVAIGHNMNYNQQQAMLAQQNSNMEALERRREQERRAAAAAAAAQRNDRPPQRVVEDEDSGDEVDQISSRTLALARYRRNHDWMNEVFHQAAFGKASTEPKPGAFSKFSKHELEEKSSTLQAEIDALKSKSAYRIDKLQESQIEQTGLSLGRGDSEPLTV